VGITASLDRRYADSVLAVCRAQVGETAFDEAWAHGAARPFEEVVEEVLNMPNSELARLTASIDAAWKDLHAFLAVVTPDQASKRDQAGWSVKDHVTHLATWEDSVAILFRGGRRHEALGIEEPMYATGSIDEINEVVKARLGGTSLEEAIHDLEAAHSQLMSHMRTLHDADLTAKVRKFFPQAPGNDDRSLSSLNLDNTGGHFTEHLEWMCDLVGRAA
jgi:hypothetical protein